MDNNDLREEEKKSLLDEMSKKGISKIIKTIPLGTKILIISIIGGFIFLLIFTVLVSTLFITLGDDSSNNTTSNLTYINNNSEDNYWWPIGGSVVEKKDGKEYATGNPTSTVITSHFSVSRTINGITKAHNGMDIGSGVGQDFIIATAQGIVYQVGIGCDNNGYYGNTCHDGFGNYVIIEHPGSVYTIYAHLYPNSITISKGESVNQGQIIGRMGNSGSSTGPHLHFQIEIGERSSNNAVNPLNYVSPTEPRPTTVISGDNKNQTQLLSMLQSWEGSGPTDGNYYIVYDDGTGELTVGHGVTLKYYSENLEKNGASANSLVKGGKIEKSIVDAVELEIVNAKKISITNMLSQNNIVLEDYRIDALVIRAYNVGNVNSFPENYRLYGISQELYDNYMSKPVKGGGKYLVGLARRRQAEWNLFYNGIYTFNS